MHGAVAKVQKYKHTNTLHGASNARIRKQAFSMFQQILKIKTLKYIFQDVNATNASIYSLGFRGKMSNMLKQYGSKN